MLEWVVMPSWPRDQTHVSCIGRQVLYHQWHLGSHDAELKWWKWASLPYSWSFTIECVGCKFFIYGLYYVEVTFSNPSLLSVFIRKDVEFFSNAFFSTSVEIIDPWDSVAREMAFFLVLPPPAPNWDKASAIKNLRLSFLKLCSLPRFLVKPTTVVSYSNQI